VYSAAHKGLNCGAEFIYFLLGWSLLHFCAPSTPTRFICLAPALCAEPVFAEKLRKLLQLNSLTCAAS